MRAIADDDDEEDDEKQVVISPVGVRQSRNAAEPPQERPSVGYIVVLAAVVGLCYAGGVYAGRLRKGSALGAGGVELAGGVNRVAPRPAATAAPGPAAPDSPAAASGPLAMPPLLDGKCCVCGLDGPLECACLPRGTSLVFMGDLFTRAQYLDLVYSLKFGSFANWTRQPAKLVAPAVAEYGVHALALHNELAPEEWCARRGGGAGSAAVLAHARAARGAAAACAAPAGSDGAADAFLAAVVRLFFFLSFSFLCYSLLLGRSSPPGCVGLRCPGPGRAAT